MRIKHTHPATDRDPMTGPTASERGTPEHADPPLHAPLVAALADALANRLAPLVGAAPRPEPLMTAEEVAEYLAVSIRTLETLIAEGELVPLRIRGARRFTREAIDSYLRSLAGRKRPRSRKAA
jgi:excisionase family DNA binding protein